MNSSKAFWGFSTKRLTSSIGLTYTLFVLFASFIFGLISIFNFADKKEIDDAIAIFSIMTSSLTFKINW